MNDVSGNGSFTPNTYQGDYLEHLRGEDLENSETQILVSDPIDYSGTLENIQTILIFQSSILIAIGCIIAWVCGRNK